MFQTGFILFHLKHWADARTAPLTRKVLMRVVLQSMQIWPEGRHVNEFIQNSLPVPGCSIY